MGTKHLLISSLSSLLLAPALLRGGAAAQSESPGFSILPPVTQTTSDGADQSPSAISTAGGQASEHPLYLAEAAQTPQIHGFASLPFTTSYITPRGLVVENQGLVMQPVAGLVFLLGDVGFFKDASIVTGVWNSINFHQNDPDVGPWNEMDFFVAFGGNLTKDLKLDITYGMWNFPQSTVAKPETEHNIDFKFSYNDKDLLGDWALHPYVDIWWAVYGSSTVVLGDEGHTWYVEPGIVPGYTCKASADYPIAFTFPTYISIGPEGYWGRGGTFAGVSAEPDGNFGVFSTAVNMTVPMAFIPARYGHWHFDAGVQYYYLINDTLLRAGEFLSGNDDRSLFRGYVGIGVNF